MDWSSSLLVLGGTTASGKSALAIDLVGHLRMRGVIAEIVNADSVQLYRHIPILTARPDAAEEARAVHHLYGVLEPDEPIDAMRWLELAAPVIAGIQARGALPILVGGTGLYMHALLHGMSRMPEIAGEVRSAVRAIPPAELHAVLAAEDPVMARRLHAGDPQRLMRALEVIRQSGRSLAAWQRQAPVRIIATDPVNIAGIALLPPRDVLHRLIERRMRNMIAGGAVEEARALFEAYPDALDLPIGKAHGLPEIAAFVGGRMDLEAVIGRTSIRVRQYAKRQSTWFRRQMPEFVVMEVFGGTPGLVDKVLMRLDKTGNGGVA
ncbi:MAG: tRNA (adenosine(37)-N6)-dimethylallyltransferase MiaA [Geminicoccaceae bacterium]|nr:tRNA (adenosine(37)-N6)-dimethylallyltransferase MiaA [Geminicoccaceae bacterium]